MDICPKASFPALPDKQGLSAFTDGVAGAYMQKQPSHL